MSSLHDDLRVALETRGLSLTSSQLGRLVLYFELLQSWNRKLNLTALDVDTPAVSAIERILIEPILASRHLPGTDSMIDVGSGGGSPGIPLAIVSEVTTVDLVESKSKKVAFLKEALRACGLGGHVFGMRFEDVRPDRRVQSYDLLTVRAVRVDPAFWRVAARILRKPTSRVAWLHSTSQTLQLPEADFVAREIIDLGPDTRMAVLTRD